jgi:hypothetical protein
VNQRAPRKLACVDVFVTVPAATRPRDAAGPAGLERLDCLTRHRVEWCAVTPGPPGANTWHFRAPDAESVRIALRHAGVPFEALRVGCREPSD